MNTASLVNALIERQRREGWSDREMARQLTVSNNTWRGIKVGRHGPGVHFIRHCMERFPEYLPLLFVPTNASNTDHIVDSHSQSREAA